MLWLYMASAGPECANLGPKQEKSIGLKSGTLLARRAQPGRAWRLSQQQAKPIWNLEKYVSAFQDRSLLPSGIPLQQSCFLCPPSLCHTHPSEGAVPSLPLAQPCLDLGGSALLYRRSGLRPKPYGFPFQSPLDTGSTTGRVMSSLLMEPCLLPVPAEEHSGTGVKGYALSSGRQASSSYRPVLNNNSFLRPSSAKVPLLQSLEIKKVKSSHSFPAAPWPHSGDDGDSSPSSLVNGAVKSSDLVLEQTTVPSLTHMPSSAIVRKDPCSQEDAERKAHSLKEKEPEISLTEAVQQLARQTAPCNGFGREVKSSGLTNVGSLFNWNSRWGQHIIAQLTPKETVAPLNLEMGSHHLNGNSSLIGTDGAVVCTKRISVHLLASHAGSPNHNADCRLVSSLSPHSSNQVERPEHSQLAAVSEVATQMSTIQLEKEEELAQAVPVGRLK